MDVNAVDQLNFDETLLSASEGESDCDEFSNVSYSDDDNDHDNIHMEDSEEEFPMSTIKISSTMTLVPVAPRQTNGSDCIGSSTMESIGTKPVTVENLELSILKSEKERRLEELLEEKEDEIDILHEENLVLQQELGEVRSFMQDQDNEIKNLKEQLKLFQEYNEVTTTEMKHPGLLKQKKSMVTTTTSTVTKYKPKKVYCSFLGNTAPTPDSDRMFLGLPNDDGGSCKKQNTSPKKRILSTRAKGRKSTPPVKLVNSDSYLVSDIKVLAANDSRAATASAAKPTTITENNGNSENMPREHGIDESRKEEGYFCICGSSFNRKISLYSHVRSQTIERKFGCTECERKYFSTRDLKSHMMTTHNIIYDKTNGCKDCGSTFDTRKKLMYHLRDAHNHGPLSRRMSTTFDDVKDSNITPEPQTPKNLEHASTQITETHTIITEQVIFALLQRLKTKRNTNGIPTNPGEDCASIKDIAVDECMDVSIKHEYLKNGEENEYKRGKRNENEYKRGKKNENKTATINSGGANCKHGIMGTFKSKWLCLCGKQFIGKQSLIDHVRLKSGVKPFKCQVCSKTFPRYDYLKYHLQTAHNIHPIAGFRACRTCGLEVKSLKKLIQHRTRMHSNDATTFKIGRARKRTTF